MKLILFSDLHLNAGGLRHGRHPLSVLRTAVTHALAHHADADACILLGDLVDTGRVQDYLTLKEDLAALPMPKRLIPGNHDSRTVMQTVFGNMEGTIAGPRLVSVLDIPPYHCLFLDSHIPGEDGGALGSEQRAWLGQELEKTPAPCLLFLHHPPLNTGLPAFDAIGLRDRDTLGDLLVAHPGRVRGLFSGHLHMPLAGVFAGVPAFGIPSLLYQGLPNFADRRFVDAPDLPPAYAIVKADDQDISVHFIPFGYDGAVVSSDFTG